MESQRLAVHGGTPIRDKTLPYGRQSIAESDIEAVTEILRSGWLTTGPKVGAFESAVAELVGAEHGVAVANGTVALAAAMFALDIGPGDEVLVPTMTFAATANCVRTAGATPVFCDVDPETLLIDVEDAASRISKRTRAIIAVDFAGQPCDYVALRSLAERHSLHIVADACHALGAVDEHGGRCGALADISTFSFHPVKPIACGEGGMVTTDCAKLASRARLYRNHGISTDFRQREAAQTASYDMIELGTNGRLSDIHCALGLSQLARLSELEERRRQIASCYDESIRGLPLRPLRLREGARSAWHLYCVLLDLASLRADRDEILVALRAEGIGVNIHYKPVHLHSYYRELSETANTALPHAEDAYQRLLTLPLFPDMTDEDVRDVVTALAKVLAYYEHDERTVK